MGDDKRIHLSSTNLKATVDDIEYRWFGGLGTAMTSYENGMKQGAVRMIGNTLFSVYRIEKRIFKKDIVSWSISDTNRLREFKKVMFSCDYDEQ